MDTRVVDVTMAYPIAEQRFDIADTPSVKLRCDISHQSGSVTKVDDTMESGYFDPRYSIGPSTTGNPTEAVKVATFLAWFEGEDAEVLARAQRENWQSLDPQILMTMLDILKQAKRGQLAWEIIHSQASWIPWDSPLMSYYNVLSRYSVRVHPSSLTPGEEASQEWFVQHRSDYRGQWVAVKDGQLLKASASRDDVLAVLETHSPGVHLARL